MNMPNRQPLTFDVDDRVKDLGVRGAYFVIRGMRNADSHPEFSELARNVLDNIKSRLSADSVEQDSVLRGFRELHDRVGASNRKHVASPENLMTYVLRSGRLPHINLIVDIYNLVSMETKLALGAHDVQKISGGVHLRITSGKERFVPLGIAEAKPSRQGVYAYIDDADDILCYLEVRQVEKTKVTLETTECFYIVQGNAATPPQDVTSAMQRTIELTQRYCGGEVYPLMTLV